MRGTPEFPGGDCCDKFLTSTGTEHTCLDDRLFGRLRRVHAAVLVRRSGVGKLVESMCLSVGLAGVDMTDSNLKRSWRLNTLARDSYALPDGLMKT